MSELDRLIQKRRSIRKYLPDLPPPAWIEEMIACAACAPSPSNSQPVRFFEITSVKKKAALFQAITKSRDDLLLKINEGKINAETGSPKKLKNLIRAYYRFSIFMFDAPVLFAVGTVFGVPGFSKKLFDAGLIPEDVRGNTDIDISVGLALHGFLLKAQERGLGACILTGPLSFVPNAGEILGINDCRLVCFVSLGFPNEAPSRIVKKSVDDIYREI
jgi:nitroreductase